MSADKRRERAATPRPAKPRERAQSAGDRSAVPPTSEEPIVPLATSSEVDLGASEHDDSDIRRRAYELYLSRGGDSDELANWLEAERLVRENRRNSSDREPPSP